MCLTCLQNAAADVEKMILGNKCDLADSRVVSKERGQLLADEHGIKFMETSAKASINVEEVWTSRKALCNQSLLLLVTLKFQLCSYLIS